jgi:hypothetical protein
LPTRAKFCFTFNKRFFTYHANMFPFMCGSKGRHLVTSSSYTPAFCSFSTHFLTTLHTCFSLPHPMVAHLSQCKCGHTIDDLRTHLLRCPYRNEHITTHNTLQDIITTIVLESGTHVQREVSHLFPHHTWWRMDILITIDDFRTLMDIIITDPTRTNMVKWTSTMTTN